MNQIGRVRLTPEKRKKLIRAYVQRCLAKDKKLPTRRQVSETLGGDVYSILSVLKEYRNTKDNE